MTALVDAAPIVAASDRRDPRRPDAQRALEDEPGPLLLSPFVAAEVDYLLHTRLGAHAARAFLRDVADGAYTLASVSAQDVAAVRDLHAQYDDLAPGLADLSLVVLAARYGTRRLITFDHRHFRVIQPLQGGSFELLPGP